MKNEYCSRQSLRGQKMEEVLCKKFNITQTASRGRNACPYDGVDDQGRRVEIKTINKNRQHGNLHAKRMSEKRGLCDRILLEWQGRVFDTAAHPQPDEAMAHLLRAYTATFNSDLKVNGKNTYQNINTQVLLECELSETV